MNRAHKILNEWRQRTEASGARTPGEARRDDELHQLRNQVAELKRGHTELQRRLDAAATVIAALHHDGEALREHLAARGHNVVQLSAYL